jgi:hypothetical protein
MFTIKLWALPNVAAVCDQTALEEQIRMIYFLREIG